MKQTKETRSPYLIALDGGHHIIIPAFSHADALDLASSFLGGWCNVTEVTIRELDPDLVASFIKTITKPEKKRKPA